MGKSRENEDPRHETECVRLMNIAGIDGVESSFRAIDDAEGGRQSRRPRDGHTIASGKLQNDPVVEQDIRALAAA